MATTIHTTVSPGELQVRSVGAATIDGSSTITIGGTTATGISIGHTGITTAFAGTLAGVANVPSSADNRIVFVNGDSTAVTSVSGFGIASGDTLTATKVQADPGTAAPTITFEGFTTSGFTRDADTASIATFVTGTYTSIERKTYNLTDDTATTLFVVTTSLSGSESFSFLLNYSIKCSTSTANMQFRTGTLIVNVIKVASSPAVCDLQDDGLTSCSTGTLGVTFSSTVTGGSDHIVTVKVTPASNLTTPTITAFVNYVIPRAPDTIAWS